jgi:hypothetical protein
MALRRFNWRSLPDWATPDRAGSLFQLATMPEIEITEECRALIASVIEPPPGRRLSNGNWGTVIDDATCRWLQRLRRKGESMSDCIIRMVIVSRTRVAWNEALRRRTDDPPAS